MLIDIHRHLEGSHSEKDVEAAKQKFEDPFAGVESLESVSSEIETKGPWTRFYDALKKAREGYVTLEAISHLTYLALMDAAQETDGFDMRFSLVSMVHDYIKNQGLKRSDINFLDYTESVMGAVQQGVEKASEEITVPFGLRYGMSRQPQYLSDLEFILPIVEDYASLFYGLDVLGRETPDSLAPLEPMITRLRSTIPDLTIHAGELLGPEGVYDALRLQPNGIGHGVHAVEDEALMKKLAEMGITLEVCQTSNAWILHEFIEGKQEAPLKTLMDRGVKVALGTDDPVQFNTCIEDEYERAKAIGVDVELLKKNSEARMRQYLDF